MFLSVCFYHQSQHCGSKPIYEKFHRNVNQRSNPAATHLFYSFENLKIKMSAPQISDHQIIVKTYRGHAHIPKEECTFCIDMKILK